MSKTQKLAMRTNPYWGFMTEFHHLNSYTDVSVDVSAYDVDEKFGDILYGLLSVTLFLT
jgi:hypothetical protein